MTTQDHPDAQSQRPPALAERGRVKLSEGEKGAAEALFRQTLEADPDQSEALCGLGILSAKDGKLDEAARYFQQALKSAPGAAEPCLNLAKLEIAKGDRQAAARWFQAAREREPDSPEVLGLLGAFHQQGEEFEDAIRHYRKALSLRPERGELRAPLAQCLLQSRQPQACLEVLAPLVAPLVTDRQQDPAPHLLAAEASLELGEAEPAIAHLEEVMTRPDLRTRALSLLAIALGSAGQREREAALLGLDSLVCPRSIAGEPQVGDLASFNRALAEFVGYHPSLRRVPSTRGGRDTKLILDDPAPCIRSLRRIIERRIEQTLAELPALGAHPFAVNRPKSYRLEGWGVVMGPQGYQIPHTHPKAWMSGVYYVCVPEEAQSGPESHLGWIEFGRGPDHLHGATPPSTRLIQPQEGCLISFPSYVWHRTFPSTSATDRISIAFDAVPTASP